MISLTVWQWFLAQIGKTGDNTFELSKISTHVDLSDEWSRSVGGFMAYIICLQEILTQINQTWYKYVWMFLKLSVGFFCCIDS